MLDKDKDSLANELRHRVTACRKRLRVNRAMVRVPIENEPKEVIADTNVSVFEFDGYPAAYRAIEKYLICKNYCSLQFETTEPRNSESLLLIAQQEVGIT